MTAAALATASVGQKDIMKSLFDVWKEIFSSSSPSSQRILQQTKMSNHRAQDQLLAGNNSLSFHKMNFLIPIINGFTCVIRSQPRAGHEGIELTRYRLYIFLFKTILFKYCV